MVPPPSTLASSFLPPCPCGDSLSVSHWKVSKLLRDNNKIKSKKNQHIKIDKRNKKKEKSPRKDTRIRDPLVNSLNPTKTTGSSLSDM